MSSREPACNWKSVVERATGYKLYAIYFTPENWNKKMNQAGMSHKFALPLGCIRSKGIIWAAKEQFYKDQHKGTYQPLGYKGVVWGKYSSPGSFACLDLVVWCNVDTDDLQKADAICKQLQFTLANNEEFNPEVEHGISLGHLTVLLVMDVTCDFMFWTFAVVNR